nr:tRNA (cytosine(34) C(5)) methyltransferase [Hymenolepis microstoma]
MGRRRGCRFGTKALASFDLSNPTFASYYKNQLQLNDAEFEEFISVMKTTLPVTFRITGFRQQNKDLLSLLQENYLHSLFQRTLNDSGDEISVVPLKWYPGETAYQINSTRLAIRKTPELKELQKFLVTESEAGNLSRQEAVSMLPPLVLGIKEHHAVLDLCAAPGSKSAQLVELLHADAESKCAYVDQYSEPSGIIVANDLDRQRCFMMIHQVKRLQSPCVILTEEDASVYPRFFVDCPENPDEFRQLYFDRILADVPCSGDGTLRKNPDLWSRWTPKLARGQHDLQKRILRRGLELLRIPASPDETDLPRLVYSTCSLNPIEDEAVVAAILNACKGTVRLIEPDLMCLPGSEAAKNGGFVARSGLKSWKVLLGSDKWYEKLDDVPDRERNSLQPSLFAPENVGELNLERCRRVLPHDQNTGGFFIAVFEKIADLPWMSSKQRVLKRNFVAASNGTETQGSDGSETKPSSAKKARMLANQQRDEAFVFVNPETDKDWPLIRSYYGIDDESDGKSRCLFHLNPAQILYRVSKVGEPIRRRNLYYTNTLVKRVIQANSDNGVVHIVSGGVKLFAVSSDKQFEGYRLLHDGINLATAFLPQIPKELKQHPPQLCHRRISLSLSEREDLLLLLKEEMPLAQKFSEAVQNQWEQLSIGPVIIDYDPESPADPNLCEEIKNANLRPRCRIAFSGWRGARSLRHYIDRHERVHIMRLCGLDASIPIVMGRSEPIEANEEVEDKIEIGEVNQNL